MGLVLAACSPSPAASGPARPAEQIAAPPTAAPAVATQTSGAGSAPRVVPPTPSPAAATSTPVAAQAAAQATKPAGPPAPDFAVQTLDGKPFSLANKRGKTVVVLFTASGCGECIPELQALARVHKAYGPRGVEILALSVDPFDTADSLGAMKQAARTSPTKTAPSTARVTGAPSRAPA
jgi:thiol-disulfide isomerase/thioredoxin